MRARGGALLVVGLLGIGAALFYSWFRDASHHREQMRLRREARRWERATLVGGPNNDSRAVEFHRRIPLEPRLFSTFAERAGPYLVSVRQIRSADGERDLVSSHTVTNRPLGRIYVVFQFIPAEPDVKEPCLLEVDSLWAQDDTGRRLRPRRQVMPQSAFAHGWYEVVMLEPPADSAQTLARLGGAILIKDRSGKWIRRPFRLTNVPLPSGSRVFGRLASRLLSEEMARSVPPGLTVLTGRAAEEAVQRSRPAPLSMPLPPQRFLVTEGLPARMRVPTPLDSTALTVNARVGPYGSFPLTLRADGSGSRWQGKVWEGEPFVIALPQERSKERRAVVVSLSRTAIPLRPPFSIGPIFPARSGRPGGAIATEVRVGDQRFGGGMMEVRLRKRTESGWSEPQRVMVPLRMDGTFVLPNVEPGEYRMERPAQTLRPFLTEGEAPPPLDAYLKERFNIGNGAWHREVLEGIVVRPGQKTEVAPLQWRPLPVQTARGSP